MAEVRCDVSEGQKGGKAIVEYAVVTCRFPKGYICGGIVVAG
jgi:hypothetical protein